MSSDEYMMTRWDVLGSDSTSNGITNIENGNKRPKTGINSQPSQTNWVRLR